MGEADVCPEFIVWCWKQLDLTQPRVGRGHILQGWGLPGQGSHSHSGLIMGVFFRQMKEGLVTALGRGSFLRPPYVQSGEEWVWMRCF